MGNTKQINLRLSDEDYDMLNEIPGLYQKLGISLSWRRGKASSSSEMIRRLIRHHNKELKKLDRTTFICSHCLADHCSSECSFAHGRRFSWIEDSKK